MLFQTEKDAATREETPSPDRNPDESNNDEDEEPLSDDHESEAEDCDEEDSEDVKIEPKDEPGSAHLGIPPMSIASSVENPFLFGNRYSDPNLNMPFSMI